MKIIVTYLLFFFTLISFISNAEQKKLKFSVPSFAPFSHFEENEKCKGISQLIVEKLLHQVNLQPHLVKLPYARILQSLQTGDIDLALIFKNKNIKSSVEYIGPISLSQVIILTDKDNLITNYNNLKDSGLIAVIRDAEFHQRFDNDAQIKKVYVNSYKQAVQMFAHKRVNAIIGSKIGIEYALRQEGMNNNKNVFLLGVKEWWLHISKQSPYYSRIADFKSASENIYHKDLSYQIYHQQIKNCLKSTNLTDM